MFFFESELVKPTTKKMMEIQSNISKTNSCFIFEIILFRKDQCYCCQLRLTGRSIQFAIRSQPFQDGNIYNRPCLICRNFMSKQIEQTRQVNSRKKTKNFNENK